MDFHQEFFAYSFGDPQFEKRIVFVERFDIARIDTDADFECKRLVCFATGDLGPQTEQARRIPDFNFNIRDNATGRTLFSGFMSTAEIFGDGRVPFILPTSHFFKKGSQAQLLYDPVDPGPDVDNIFVWLVMVGAKHFEKG